MAVTSGMNYAGMDAIVTLVGNRMTAISGILDTLSTDVVSKIASAYSGEAATAYQDTLNKISQQMTTDLEELTTSLKVKITETQSNYVSQDRKMEESVSEARASVSSGD